MDYHLEGCTALEYTQYWTWICIAMDPKTDSSPFWQAAHIALQRQEG